MDTLMLPAKEERYAFAEPLRLPVLDLLRMVAVAAVIFKRGFTSRGRAVETACQAPVSLLTGFEITALLHAVEHWIERVGA
jgi:hypothetical protein